MSDLVSRLLAAIEETEQEAKHTEPGPWGVWPGDVPGEFVVHTDYNGKPAPDRVATTHGLHCAEQNARWIAMNDPAAVLRRYAADKRQVQRLAEMVELGEEYYDNPTVWDLVQDSLKDFADSYGISVEEETTHE